MPNKKTSNPSYKWLIIVGVIVSVYVLTLFLPLISPFTKLPIYLVKCGGLPISASKAVAGRDYQLPTDSNYSIFIFTTDLFCTEEEAQKAGYTHRTDY